MKEGQGDFRVGHDTPLFDLPLLDGRSLRQIFARFPVYRASVRGWEQELAQRLYVALVQRTPSSPNTFAESDLRAIEKVEDVQLLCEDGVLKELVRAERERQLEALGKAEGCIVGATDNP